MFASNAKKRVNLTSSQSVSEWQWSKVRFVPPASKQHGPSQGMAGGGVGGGGSGGGGLGLGGLGLGGRGLGGERLGGGWDFLGGGLALGGGGLALGLGGGARRRGGGRRAALGDPASVGPTACSVLACCGSGG